jgi:GxxExxY protein
MTVTFLETVVGDYRADLIVEGKVIVETKTVEKILPVHEMQLAFSAPNPVFSAVPK